MARLSGRVFFKYNQKSKIMLPNHLKIALRHLWRNRLFTSLNVLGLAIGLSAAWIIFRIVTGITQGKNLENRIRF
jgi:hypothetical protein